MRIQPSVFSLMPAVEEGPKLRIRAESFADHYSQARQFYISQTAVEQNHIADSFTFRTEQGGKTRHSSADGLSSAERR